jgi:hypothetical protein
MHPTNRAERRFQREFVILHRRDIRINGNARDWPEQNWSHYSKWNGNCGSTRCHAAKYFKVKAKRRKARRSSWSQAQCRAGDRKVYR